MLHGQISFHLARMGPGVARGNRGIIGGEDETALATRVKVLRRKSAELLLRVIMTRVEIQLNSNPDAMPDELAMIGRQLLVAEMLVKGFSYREIATATGVKSLRTVHEDVQKCIQAWREERADDIDHQMILALAKFDRIENEAWDAWERSKNLTALGMVRNTIDVENPSSRGDSKFLEIALKTSAARCKLLGLDAPDTTVVLHGRIQSALEGRAARAVALFDAIRARRAGQPAGEQPGAGYLLAGSSVVDVAALSSSGDRESQIDPGTVSASVPECDPGNG